MNRRRKPLADMTRGALALQLVVTRQQHDDTTRRLVRTAALAHESQALLDRVVGVVCFDKAALRALRKA